MDFDLAVFGLIVADVLARPMDIRRPPAPGGLVKVDQVALVPGGNVPNVGMAAAKLGLRVSAHGVTGDDALGQAVVSEMTRQKLDCSGVRALRGQQTSATIVAVEPGGERIFFHAPAANEKIDANTFRAAIPALARAATVQIGYLGLLGPMELLLPELLLELREVAPDIRIALDTVNPPGPAERLPTILPHVDVFCPSRSEAVALTEQTDPDRMIDTIREWMPRGIVGIKLDAQGCLIDFASQREKIPAFRVIAIDSTGAGDCWFAGLLTALTRGLDPFQAARLANRVAADCCTALGATAGVRGWEQTLMRIND
jgi:sugar/nucleoside kinase (ribokinase family)